MNNEEAQREVSLNNGALLFATVGGGEPARFIDDISARKLLAKITTVNTGQGGASYLIPEAALRDAGIDMKLWEKAEKMKMVRSVATNGERQFELPHEVSIGEHLVVNTLVSHLESLAGISYQKARSRAGEDAGQSTGQAR